MNDVDHLFRTFLDGTPDLPDAACERVVRAVTRRDASRRHGRRVRWSVVVPVVGGMAVALVAGAAMFDREGTDTAVAGRVDWGMTAVLRVTPDPGSDLETALSRMEAALTVRGEADDIPGLAVRRVGNGDLEIRVPGVYHRQQMTMLSRFASVAVYDRRRALIGTYRRMDELTAALTRQKGAPQGYVLLSQAPGSPVGMLEVVTTRAEADAKLRELNRAMAAYEEKQSGTSANVVAAKRAMARWTVAEVPGGVRVVARGQGPGVDLLRDDPIVPSRDIDSLQENNGVTMTVVPEARERTLRALAASRSSAVAVFSAPGYTGSLAGPVSVDGETLVASGSPDGVVPVSVHDAVPNIPGAIAVVSAQPYGHRPTLEGERVSPLPADIEALRTTQWDPRGETRDRLDIAPQSVLRVVRATRDGVHQDVYAARTPDGDDLVYVGRNDGSGGNACSSDAGPPRMTLCMTRAHADDPFVGRVDDPAIVRVDAEWDGGSRSAVVANGWFIVDTLGEGRPPSATTMIGRDADGNEVARLSGVTGELRLP